VNDPETGVQNEIEFWDNLKMKTGSELAGSE
jgi:hypothetical protein